MRLAIQSIADAGDLQKERIIFRARQEVDIGSFAVFRSKRHDEGGPISGSKDAYWFPDITVSAGDLIVLYTRSGKSSKKKLAEGRTAHFYYWHKKKSFWAAEEQNVVVLVDIEDWDSKAPSQP